MKTIKILFILFFAQQIALAQHFKLSATQGFGIDANKKNDSLFFVKNCNVSHLRVGYHYGKLGIILNNTFINQNDVDITLKVDERVPLFIGAINPQQPRTAADVKTLLTTLGLELCIPILKHKAQINIYSAYGVGFSKSDSVAFYNVNKPVYSHKVNRKTSGCFQLGVSVNYKINKQLAVKWQNEYDCYNLHYDALDVRKLINNFSGSQRKNLFASSIGVQYKF